MHIQRLTTLVALLATVPPEKFDMTNWRQETQDDDGGGPNLGESLLTDKKLRDPGCGTSGCAVGWACALPAFKRQGLKWSDGTPAFNGYRGWSAVTEFFELGREQADRLFSDECYKECHPTTEDVAARISALLKDATKA